MSFYTQIMQAILNLYKRKISKWSVGVCVFLYVLFRCNVQRVSVTNNGNGERGCWAYGICIVIDYKRTSYFVIYMF